MGGRYKAYPEYRDSGVEWLGEIPFGWNILRGKFVFHEHSERSEAGDEVLLSVSEYYGVKPRGDVVDEGDFLSRAESLVGYKKCEKNDLVMNIMLAWKRGLGVSKYDGIVSPAYSVFRFGDFADPNFMHYLFRTDIYVDHFKTRSTGVIDSRLRLYPESFFDVSTLLPSRFEQARIANFLDHETAKIDTLIDKQQQLIQLLKEKRQAVISHAVTKGLNPNAKMRDSGVEWLGEVPEHWSLVQLRYMCTFFGGGTPSKENPDFWDGDIPWISPKDMKTDYIFTAQDKITRNAVLQSATKMIKAGAVLIVVRGMILDHSVPVALTRSDLTINQDMKALVPDSRIDGEYLLYCLKGMRDIILNLVESSAHGTKCLRTDQFERLEIPLPSLQEQREIVKGVKAKLVAFDDLIAKAGLAIELASERRTALISAAVTGKIDVRDWVPPTADPRSEESA